MKLVVRVDGCPAIGAGHVMRCLALAAELRARGARIHFFSRFLSENLRDRIRADGCGLTLLPASKQVPQVEDHATWLGETPEVDALQMISAMRSEGAGWDLLLIDHYAIGEPWQRHMASTGIPMAVIDDLVDRKHLCAMLINPTCNPSKTASFYAAYTPVRCTHLLGARYAILRAEFHRLRSAARRQDGASPRVCVFFGGGGARIMYPRLLSLLSEPGFAHLHVELLSNGDLARESGMQELLARRRNTTLHVDSADVAEVMNRCDLYIGSASGASIERCCLGLAAMLFVTAANQLSSVQLAVGRRTGIRAGHGRDPGRDQIRRRLAWLIDHPGVRRRMAWRASQMIDGEGARRIAERMVRL